MNTDFLKLLPESIRTKVDAIERAIEGPIVVHRESTAHHIGNNSTPPRAICVCDDQRGRIPVKITLSREAVCHNLIHEILHAYRVVVLGVPRLCSPENLGVSLVVALENDAEHLCIVPEEISLASEAQTFWESEESNHFDELTKHLSACSSDASELQAARHGIVRLWLFVTQILPNWPRRHELRELLQRRDWKASADRLVDEVSGSGLDKAKVVAALLRSGNLPVERFRLRSWKAQSAEAIET
jgi:hypothetical protein